MSQYPTYIIDAFTSTPFRGNPAGVVLLPPDQQLPDAQLQKIAGELNQTETAFVTPTNAFGPDAFRTASQFGLRWFTPTQEIKLCGHATLATAHVLFTFFENVSSVLRFNSLSVTEDVRTLAASVYGEYLPDTEVLYAPSLRFLLLHNPTLALDTVDKLTPNITGDAYAAGKRLNITGLVVTSRASDKDFKSRLFGPWIGIPEDPVTGATHTILAPYWAERLAKKVFSAAQVSKRRGDLEVEIVSDTHVQISGKAVAVLQGVISV
ncbi:Diaminopimelate epimerase-like protein [Linderina pennispora]|uniref:Diaminopimelate epimerase-like protein n=1 Tax=Linderina pennispora TaxID=61395 RepID=A0A1Y1VY39_9FUNG|nr:Diaminopimelate epimerase-like protein [Linderina pennispora]ORX65926.1 Diaminopimelate epimerase-like protein [Linderina pennispora]